MHDTLIFSSRHAQRLAAILFLGLVAFSGPVFATLEGTFTGSGNASFVCNAPSIGPYNVPVNVLLVANGTSFTLALKDPGGRYAYDGSGGITQSGNNFIFNATGKVQIKVGNAGIDGTYDPSFLNNFVYTQNGDKLDIVNSPSPELNILSQTPCGDISITVTLDNLALSSGQLVVSEETPGSSVTDALLFNTQIQNTVNGISNRITGALTAIRTTLTPRFSNNGFKLEGQTGLNAGDDEALPYGIWGNYSYTDYENDLSSTAFDGSSHGFLGGIDVAYWNNAIVGVAVGFETADIDTTFNGGNQATDTFTIAPYYGWMLNDVLSLDFNLGYSYVDYDQFRTNAGTRISSSPSADRFFGAFNLNTIYFVNNWVLGGRVGFLYARSKIDNFTESNGAVVSERATRVGTFSVAADAAYSLGNFEPFLNVSYQYDFTLLEISTATGPQPTNDNDDILLTTGVRYFEKSGISGNMEYSKRMLRDNYDEDRVSLTVRLDY